MNAECTRTKLRFQGLDGRDVVGRFDGGEITSDAGGVLLREVEQRTRILGRLSECFTDYRDPDRVEHPVEALIKQRVLGLCLGYEDLNDHDELCRDRLLALLCDRDDLTGEFRRVESDRGKPLAGKSTLNRLERTPLEGPEGAYKKIVADPAGMDELLLEVFVEAHPEPPEEVILDVDATDDPLHGKQEGRFFHGYYKRYCYLPLYVFCGEHLLCARLRTADRGAAHGVVAKVEHLPRGKNPRFIVTSVPVQECDGRRLYEEVYCARGDMENRIKEQQLGLFADRTSTRKLAGNQLRLYFSAFAYVMMETLRRVGLAGTKLARAQSWTLRVRLLKIGAQVRITSRKVWLSFSESYPYAALLRTALTQVQALPLRC